MLWRQHMWQIVVLFHSLLTSTLNGGEYVTSHPGCFTYGDRTLTQRIGTKSSVMMTLKYSIHRQTSNLTLLCIISYKLQLCWYVNGIWPYMLLYSFSISSWLPCSLSDVNKATSTAVRCSVRSTEHTLLTVVTLTWNTVLLWITFCTYVTNNFTFLQELHLSTDIRYQKI
jgi:hypothetical protein